MFDSSVARNYLDYGVSVSKSWGNLGVSLGYVGTSRDGDANFGKLADDREIALGGACKLLRMDADGGCLLLRRKRRP